MSNTGEEEEEEVPLLPLPPPAAEWTKLVNWPPFLNFRLNVQTVVDLLRWPRRLRSGGTRSPRLATCASVVFAVDVVISSSSSSSSSVLRARTQVVTTTVQPSIFLRSFFSDFFLLFLGKGNAFALKIREKEDDDDDDVFLVV